MFKSNTILVPDFTTLIRSLFRFLTKELPTNKFILMPEIDGIGLTQMPTLIRDEVIEKMIFRRMVHYDTKFNNPELLAYSKKISDDVYIRYGATMKRGKRDYLTKELMNLLAERYPYAFDFKDCYSEMATLTMSNRTQRIEAAMPFHDDVIMAMLHAYSLMFDAEYKAAVEIYHKFYVDLLKMEIMPIGVSMAEETREYEEDNKVEGTVEWVVRKEWHPVLEEEYEVLEVYKVLDGRRQKLMDEAVQNECMFNSKLLQVYRNLKRPNYLKLANMAKRKQTSVVKPGLGNMFTKFDKKRQTVR